MLSARGECGCSVREVSVDAQCEMCVDAQCER